MLLSIWPSPPSPSNSKEFDSGESWSPRPHTPAILVGVIFGGAINYWGQGYYRKRLIANDNKIIPEARLVPMIIGAFFFAAGLFIMGWTAKASIHWIGFCVGAACIGLGFFTIFQSAINYLVDTYLMLAASALAANMFMRSALAAAFPLFARACKSFLTS